MALNRFDLFGGEEAYVRQRLWRALQREGYDPYDCGVMYDCDDLYDYYGTYCGDDDPAEGVWE